MCGDQKQKGRASELMAQLKGDGYKENETNLRSLVERGEKLGRAMYENSIETQHIMSGRELWDLESDTSSDTGSDDATQLTLDGTEVIQKEYVLISGHYALITYRKKLDQIDPYLLLKLCKKREKEIAKWEARNKDKGKESTKSKRYRYPKPCMPESLTGVKPTPHRSISSGSNQAGKLGDGFTDLQERLAKTRLEDAELRSEVSRRRRQSSVSSSKSNAAASASPSPFPSAPPSLSDLSSMTFSTTSSARSFRARAERAGLVFPGNSANSSKKRSIVDTDEDVDIWLKIADEEEQ